MLAVAKTAYAAGGAEMQQRCVVVATELADHNQQDEDSARRDGSYEAASERHAAVRAATMIAEAIPYALRDPNLPGPDFSEIVRKATEVIL